MKIPLSRPDITDVEQRAVMEVLQSPYLSLGPKLPEFEEAMARYIGVRHAVAVNSGTSALHLIIRSLGIGPGDEVITTPFSFIASANCIAMEGARPLFVDIDPATYNIDAAKIEQVITPRTKAILGVDVFGRCAAWNVIEAIARKHNLFVVEDSCEAIGAEFHGRKAGSFGVAGCLAFYPNKQMTTGEGGMVLTNEDRLAALCRSMRNQGREEGAAWLEHARLGFNYRLSDINCALGLAQLSRIDEILTRRARVAELYSKRLQSFRSIVLPLIPATSKEVSWFVYVVRLADEYTQEDRDQLLRALRASGIGCNNYFPPIHLQPYYANRYQHKAGDFPATEHVCQRTIALPFFSAMTAYQVDEVVEALEQHIRNLGGRM